MKIYRAAVATLTFLCILVAIYYVHVQYFKVNVVFYSAVHDGVLAAGLAAVVLFLFPYFKVFNGFEKSLLILIWLMAAYAMAISGPAVIDRSLSFYILEKIQQRGGGIKQDRLAEVFTQEYLKEHRLMDVRLTEQLESGTIAINEGCVQLTPKGERLASFGRYFRQNWLPKHRLLLGVYGDDLTDPFRTGLLVVPDYTCSSRK